MVLYSNENNFMKNGFKLTRFVNYVDKPVRYRFVVGGKLKKELLNVLWLLEKNIFFSHGSSSKKGKKW